MRYVTEERLLSWGDDFCVATGSVSLSPPQIHLVPRLVALRSRQGRLTLMARSG